MCNFTDLLAEETLLLWQPWRLQCEVRKFSHLKVRRGTAWLRRIDSLGFRASVTTACVRFQRMFREPWSCPPRTS